MQTQNLIDQAELEELTPLSEDEQDASVGGIAPLIILGVYTAARFAPAAIRATPAVVAGVTKVIDFFKKD